MTFDKQINLLILQLAIVFIRNIKKINKFIINKKSENFYIIIFIINKNIIQIKKNIKVKLISIHKFFLMYINYKEIIFSIITIKKYYFY